MTRLVYLFLLVGACALSTSAEKVEDGWKGLLPFKSTKADVERLMGPGKRTRHESHFQFEYRDRGATLRVDYSGEPCSALPDSPSRFDLPLGTIVRYEVRLSEPLPLQELTFEKKRFERTVMIGTEEDPKAISYLQWEFDMGHAPNQKTVGYEVEIKIAGEPEAEVVWGYLHGFPFDLSKFKCAD